MDAVYMLLTWAGLGSARTQPYARDSLPVNIPLPPEWEESAHQAKISVCAQILRSDLVSQHPAFATFLDKIAHEAAVKSVESFPQGTANYHDWALRTKCLLALPQIPPKDRSKRVTYALVRVTAEGFNDVKRLWDETVPDLPQQTAMLERLGRGYIDLNRYQSRINTFSQNFPYVRDSSLLGPVSKL
ncbi:MAG: hypothetical protein Q8K75_12620 [Chlamydiales bacterium]|nr:hypothetical protein [Chlamydiales bacterium]